MPIEFSPAVGPAETCHYCRRLSVTVDDTGYCRKCRGEEHIGKATGWVKRASVCLDLVIPLGLQLRIDPKSSEPDFVTAGGPTKADTIPIRAVRPGSQWNLPVGTPLFGMLPGIVMLFYIIETTTAGADPVEVETVWSRLMNEDD